MKTKTSKQYPFEVEQHGVEDGDIFFTTSEYWDCECDCNYIHKQTENRDGFCNECGAIEEDQPDSRANEVMDMLNKPIDVSYKEIENTVYVRLLEMTMENLTTKPNDVPLIMQFFRDLKIYGLNEAIAYVKDYEKSGDYVRGAAEAAETVRCHIIDNLKNPMAEQETYVIDEDEMENIFNRYNKVYDELPEIKKYGEQIGDEWVQELSRMARIPLEVAYVFVVNEYIPEVVSDEVERKAAELQASGKVTVDI